MLKFNFVILGAYNPGMMTDIVREVKDAARVREDALLNRVKSLVEERQWSLNEYHLKIMRDLEDIKVSSNSYLFWRHAEICFSKCRHN